MCLKTGSVAEILYWQILIVFFFFIATHESQQPEGEDQRVENVAECHQNGDGGPDAAEGEETRQEEECDGDEAADSPAVGQQ